GAVTVALVGAASPTGLGTATIGHSRSSHSRNHTTSSDVGSTYSACDTIRPIATANPPRWRTISCTGSSWVSSPKYSIVVLGAALSTHRPRAAALSQPIAGITSNTHL